MRSENGWVVVLWTMVAVCGCLGAGCKRPRDWGADAADPRRDAAQYVIIVLIQDRHPDSPIWSAVAAALRDDPTLSSVAKGSAVPPPTCAPPPLFLPQGDTHDDAELVR